MTEDGDPELEVDLEREEELMRLRNEVDDFAARLRLAGAALIVLGLLIAVYVVAAHII